MSLRSAGTYALIVVATLAGAELLARAWDWSPRSRDAAKGDALGLSRYYHSFEGYGDLVPNQDGHWMIWFHRPYRVQTNSVGLRHVEEPAPDAVRILAVGDSQTFGPYLANDDTWPAWTEAALRQRPNGGAPVQVFNAGIAGYTIADELAYLRDKGIAFAPTLVVLGVFENDLLDLRDERGGALQRPAAGDQARSALSTSLKVLGRNSALASLAEQLKADLARTAAGVDTRRGEGQTAAPAAAPPDTEALAARYRALFAEMAAMLRGHGIGFAAVFIPAADVVAGLAPSLMRPVIEQAAAETATPLLDLTPIFEAVSDAAQRLFLLQRAAGGGLVGNGHLSREGNAVIGKALARWLEAQRLLPPATAQDDPGAGAGAGDGAAAGTAGARYH